MFFFLVILELGHSVESKQKYQYVGYHLEQRCKTIKQKFKINRNVNKPWLIYTGNPSGDVTDDESSYMQCSVCISFYEEDPNNKLRGQNTFIK